MCGRRRAGGRASVSSNMERGSGQSGYWRRAALRPVSAAPSLDPTTSSVEGGCTPSIMLRTGRCERGAAAVGQRVERDAGAFSVGIAALTSCWRSCASTPRTGPAAASRGPGPGRRGPPAKQGASSGRAGGRLDRRRGCLVQGGSFFATSHAALTSPARFCITATTLSPWASGEGAPPPSASDLSLKSGCRCALDMLKIARTSAGTDRRVREKRAPACV